ncbi:MAG: TolC family protein [Phycisphaerales bacterium]|nr:TolC family protein [Phycisphaerales bacterium]
MIDRLKTRMILASAASACAAVIVAGCSTKAPPAFDALALQLNERTTASQVQTPTMNPLPGDEIESPYLDADLPADARANKHYPPPTTGPAGLIEGELPMTLQELITRTVMHSKDIRVAGYQPAIAETAVIENEANFDPVFFANTGFQHIDQVNTDSGTPFFANQDRIDAATGIRQNLYSGATAELRYEARHVNLIDTSSFSSGTKDPYYTSNLVMELTQPLLRNFGTEINRSRIEVERNNQRISTLDLRNTVEETIFNLEQAYWQLVQAQRDVTVLEQLLSETEATADIVSARINQDASRVQVSQTVSSVEQRRAALVRAKAHVRDLSDTIKRLVGDPALPISSKVVIVPATDAITAPFQFDYQEAISTAMENRLELGQQQLRIDSAGIAERYFRNNLQPKLNLVGTASLQGMDDSLGGAWSDQWEGHQVSYGLALQFEIPLGNRQARALYTRSRLQRQQSVDQYEGLIDQVALDVKTAQREVQTSWDEMVATKQARLAAREALDLTIVRREAGEPLTPEFVNLELQLQAELAKASQAENQAVSNYNIAIARFERSKGTLLHYDNVLLRENEVTAAQQPLR